MHLKAPAKLNLHLRVGRRGPDGFHPVLTWMCSIGLFDEMDMAWTDGPPGLFCDDPALPVDESNLVVRAMLAFSRMAPRLRPLSVHLRKHIPAGAGLGGGSSDAARALLGLDAMHQTGLSRQQLAELAAGLGSDVPFFLHLPCAVCRGRGQIVQPVAAPRPRWAVLILPGFAMPTARVYGRFDELGLGEDQALQEPLAWTEWSALQAEPLLARLVNDLEPAAFSLAPDLGRIHQQAQRILARPVRMSGSGSSLFTLYDGAAEASLAARMVQERQAVGALAVQLAPDFRDDLDAPARKS
mgnify:CR=1 FL=1